jgi:hypothetical protein
MLNQHLSQKLKLVENSEFTHLINILTPPSLWTQTSPQQVRLNMWNI